MRTHRPRWAAVICVACQLGCSEQAASPARAATEQTDDGSSREQSVRSERFWSTFRIDGEWVEHQPDFLALARSADLVATGRIVAMLEPLVIQGDAKEDVVSEARLVLRVERARPGDVSPGMDVTMTMISASPPSESDQARLKQLLPTSEVLVLLRKRDNGLYRVVNGFGLWAATTRSTLDCPIEAHPESCLELLTQEGTGESFEKLVTRLGL